MEMIEVKTAELIGPALDWAVGSAVGERGLNVAQGWKIVCTFNAAYQPSTDWSQGGPLRDKYKVAVYDVQAGGVAASLRGDEPEFWIDEADFEADATGSTALIAICRAIVAAKLGDAALVPAALVGGMA